jgi:hypothetical protein
MTNEFQKIESTISEHAVTLGILVKSVNNIEGFMEESVKSQMRQEVLMEKLANFEANTKTSFDRIHSRVDKLEADITLKEKSVRDHIDQIEPMAANGDRVHSGMMFTAKALGGLVITMLFGLVIWAIQASHYKG